MPRLYAFTSELNWRGMEQAEGEVKHERKPATRNRRYKALFKGRPHSGQEVTEGDPPVLFPHLHCRAA
jgi:hypothetical protein